MTMLCLQAKSLDTWIFVVISVVVVGVIIIVLLAISLYCIYKR